MPVTVRAHIKRAATPAVAPAVVSIPPPGPPPEPNKRPRVFRRASVRVRLERNRLVMGEISGRLDFETELEEGLRQQTGASTGDLQLEQTAAAAVDDPQNPNDNPEDGVVDFLLNVTFDTATHQLSERVMFGAAPEDRNGLLRMSNPRTGTASQVRFKDIFGALLVLAPVINSAASAVDPDSAGDWVALGVTFAVPIAVGATGVFQTERITLYGGELKLRQHVPPGERTTFTDAGITFDYGVEFGIEIAQLNIRTTKPLKVRYKAAGFNLHFQDGVHYQPIFDTTQGYELDLSDPGLFRLPPPLGDLLKVFGARVARVNPLTLEMELGLKADLGVVTVDRFKVRWPLDPLGVPSILPTGVKIDISNVLLGSGYVHIVEATPNAAGGMSGGGFDGAADVSLVPLKLRLAASLGVRNLQVGDRRAVAVFAGVSVTFDTPIALGASGLGLFGLSGLFAMHYKRDEQPPDGTAVSPALRWLIRSRGDPSQLVVNGDAIWRPELDRWSFGLGAVLGTLEGGFVANLRGMLVLELPGPRILIFVKLKIIAKLPKLGDANLDAGLLGVIDLDFARRQLTVGVVADIDIANIIAITLPTELFVKLDNPRKWHLYLGTHRAPASATILNLVRASGYFMIEGDRIVDWQGTTPPTTLTGLALAAGLEASIIIGSVRLRLYLRVAAGAHLGVSFSPKLFIAGRIFLEGELRLFFISIEARGELEVQALVEPPVRTFIRGKICGKVSLGFIKLKGCVGLTIGTPLNAPPPPTLIAGVYLQSHAPVLSAGQGGDRPIDASLGNAVEVTPGSAATPAASLPKVPIDSVPVVQLAASPLVNGTTTFTGALAPSPQQTADGFVSLGGGRQARWRLRDITLTPPLSPALGVAPATWRTPRPPDPQSADTTIDLALMSRVPTVGERALERSTELDALIAVRWSRLCSPVAPAACVLHTFCGQQLGPSGDGWALHGTPWPDPPGTIRTAPVPTLLEIDEPSPTHAQTLLDLVLQVAGLGATAPAEVIGPNEGAGPPAVFDLRCEAFTAAPSQPNPLVRPGVRFEVRDGPDLIASHMFQQHGARFGLYLAFRTDVIFDAPTRAVELELLASSFPATVRAFGADGQQVAVATTTFAPDTIAALRLEAPPARPIVRLRFDSAGDRLFLFRLCFEISTGVSPRRLSARRAPRPTGDARRDRLAREFAERRSAREQLALADVAERASALSARPARGLSQFAAPAAHAAATPTNPGGDRRCWRALKLPQRNDSQAPDALELTPELQQAAAQRPESQWVVLRTGPFTAVTIYLAIAEKLLARDGLLVEQLDATGAVLDSTPLSDLAMTTVTDATTGMPAQWLDPAGAWLTHVQPVATFLAEPAFSDLVRLVVAIEPVQRADRIRLLVPDAAPIVPPHAVVVGVLQVCPAADADRQFADEEVREGEIATMIDYLNGGAVVPLLAPGTTYALKLRYDVSTRLQGGLPGGATSVTQEFRFRTDDAAPARLDPWVLGTTPDDEDRFHFTADPVKLVFNDLAVIQLFAAYGKQLRFVLRTADGVPIPTHEVAELDPVDAGLETPYHEFLEGMVAAGELPCVGTATAHAHGSWTSPVQLRPLMDYTVDVETDPPPAPPPPTRPQSPFFRRAFTTSRFAGVAELVADVQGRRIRHRALTAPIAGLPATAPVAVATDAALEAALLAAGERLLPAPAQSAIAVYWVRRPGSTAYVPHAILVDAIEPLWRTRQEPVLETVPRAETLVGDFDPAYKRIVPATVPALRLVESGTSEVARFVRSPGGTRTLALLKDPGAATLTAGDRTLTIVAERTPSVLYGLSLQTIPILTLALGARAPWETDDA